MTVRLLFILLIVLTAFGCRINRGFEALKEYNYFDAKKNFEKSLKKKTSPAAYGLSVIYHRTDNPFHNPDSAYHYALLAVESYNLLSEKSREKLSEDHAFGQETVVFQRNKVSESFYREAKSINTVKAYRNFIANHPWSELKDSAIYLRDLLAFEQALRKNTSKAYREYLQYYPESEQYQKAQVALHKAEFEETVIPNDPESYARFIEIFPNNPLVEEAKARIYQLETEENTKEVYAAFIKKYPESPYVSDAWKNLYRLSIADYNEKSINDFVRKYPEFPFPELIQRDLQLVGREMYLYKLRGKYGFMDSRGLPLIPPVYDFAQNFSNGLAVVMRNDKFGYINKTGDPIIDFMFDDAQDFNHGRAIVEVNGKLGLINPTGAFVLDPVYEDIGAFSEGLFYVQDEKGYQYYTLEGKPAFDIVFDEAFSFENRKAYVTRDGINGFIGRGGNFLISSYKGKLRRFSDTIYVLEMRDSMNFITEDSVFLFPRFFERIGNLKNNRAIVSTGNMYGYVNGKAELIIPMELNVFPNYFQFAQFHEGHARRYVNDKFGLIDTLGKRVLPAIFTGIGEYGVLIPVTKGDLWGYTNKDAKLIIDYKFDYAFPFRTGYAFIDKLMKMGMINVKGEQVIAPEYDELEWTVSDLILFKKGEETGILDKTGKRILAQTYKRIVPVSESLLRMEDDEKIDYYDVSKSRLITLQLEHE
ncbi:MAG: WG repeat-containing protein [Brumimicrobium sp.]|nr:WG repeat-containing protein [Brumimicrobium sp.]